jgi:hypothetical protein
MSKKENFKMQYALLSLIFLGVFLALVIYSYNSLNKIDKITNRFNTSTYQRGFKDGIIRANKAWRQKLKKQKENQKNRNNTAD